MLVVVALDFVVHTATIMHFFLSSLYLRIFSSLLVHVSIIMLFRTSTLISRRMPEKEEKYFRR